MDGWMHIDRKNTHSIYFNVGNECSHPENSSSLQDRWNNHKSPKVQLVKSAEYDKSLGVGAKQLNKTHALQVSREIGMCLDFFLTKLRCFPVWELHLARNYAYRHYHRQCHGRPSLSWTWNQRWTKQTKANPYFRSGQVLKAYLPRKWNTSNSYTKSISSQ